MTEKKRSKKKKRKRRIHIRIPSTVLGLEPTEWDIEVTGAGMKANKTGERDSLVVTWRTLLGVLLVHGSRGAISSRDAASHLKKKKKRKTN